MMVNEDRLTKNEKLTLFIILLVAVLTRIFIASIFYGQSSDEYCNINLIRSTFTSGFKSYPNLFMWFYYFSSALILFLINDALTAARIITIGFGVSSLFIFYLIARKIADKRVALLSLFLLLINPEFNLIGSIPLKEPVYTFFILFSLLLLINKHYFAGAFSVGIAFLTRAEGLIIGMSVYCV